VSLEAGKAPAQPEKPAAGKGKKKKKKSSSKVKSLWEQTIPVRAEALVVAGGTLCLAGAPDVADKQDPWGAFENRKGGVLLLLSRTDGRKLAEKKLASAPVYDGMAAAGGRLFIALKNGTLACWGKP
jgi:hypothetical protein